MKAKTRKSTKSVKKAGRFDRSKLKRFAVPIGVVVVFGAIGTYMLFTSYAATPDVLTHGTGNLCSHDGSGDCLSSRGAPGNIVYTKRYVKNSSEQSTTATEYQFECGDTGHVTDHCPFASHAMNVKYHGDQIIVLVNDPNDNGYGGYGVWYGVNTNPRNKGYEEGVDRYTDNRTGYLWVADDQFYDHALINVALSNTKPYGTKFLCEASTDLPVYVQGFFSTNGYCSWKFH